MTGTPPRWLITGATGFLGANVCEALAGRATRIGFARSTGPGGLADEWLLGDLRRPEELVALVREANPDVILHAAALASHEACERDPDLAHVLNVQATETLATAAEGCGARFIFISTDAVFDGSRGRYSEADEPNPFSIYGRTKLDAEQRAARLTEALIIRTNFFGWSPSGTRSILEFFINSLSAGTPVKGFTDFRVTSLYAQSLAECIWDLSNAGARGVVHVASHDAMTKYEFGVQVAEAFGMPALITPTRADVSPPRDRDLSLDVGKAEGILGRFLQTQGEGIERARLDMPILRERLRSRGPL